MKRRNFLTTAVATGATLTALNSFGSTEPTQPFIVKAGKPRFDDYNPGMVLKVSAKDTNGEFCLFESKNEAGPMAGPPLHTHKYQDEIFQIIEGEYVFQVGDKQIKASAGDFVFGPRNVPHTFYQLSKKAHMIFSYNPAGKMEDIMRAMTKFFPHNIEEFAKAAAENDVPFVGPPMSKPE
jgi:quercetin dioxygenase-like cupin family protein